MGKIATTIDEQIQQLTDRGMCLDGFNKQKVKEILLDIGYYRLGFYWNPFEINNQHQLKKGTQFSDIVSLYYLDVDIRNLLIKATNRIEINFRTKLIYTVSNKHKNTPTWFVDKKVMSQSFINKFNNYYNQDFIKHNKPIKNHHGKYINDKFAPAWKTLEFFTFGSILTIYLNLLDTQTQEFISKEFNINDVTVFTNYMTTIKYIRNVSAHGGVLFDLQTPKGIRKIKEVQFTNSHSLDTCIRVICFILSNISQSRKNDLCDELNELLIKNSKNKVLENVIKQKIGYINTY